MKTMRLPCMLKPEEVLDAARALADQLKFHTDLEDQLAGFKKQIGAEIQKCEGEIARTREMVASGIEYREVEVLVENDWPKGARSYTRTDTGEEFRVERIPDEERQRHMELKPAPAS